MLEDMRAIGISSSSYRSKFYNGKLGVLGKRDFRRFYIGYSASLLGTAMSSVAIAFAVLGASGTPSGLGVVFAANIVPMIAFTLGGGAIADRLGRRPVMLAADAVRCAAQGGLAVSLYLGHPRLWLFVAAALAVGAGNAFFRPALAGLPGGRPEHPGQRCTLVLPDLLVLTVVMAATGGAAES
jgi:MFS family permease